MAVSGRRFVPVVWILVILALIVGSVWVALAIDNGQETANTQNTDTSEPKQTDSKIDKESPQDKPITKALKVYYIAIEDGGISGAEVGCGDSAVAVDTEPVTTSSPARAALEKLLANHNKDYGRSGLYNALYQSNLSVESVNVTGDTVQVDLVGTLTLGGECDNPRAQAQLERTAQTAAGVNKAAITINGEPLSKVLSLK